MFNTNLDNKSFAFLSSGFYFLGLLVKVLLLSIFLGHIPFSDACSTADYLGELYYLLLFSLLLIPLVDFPLSFIFRRKNKSKKAFGVIFLNSLWDCVLSLFLTLFLAFCLMALVKLSGSQFCNIKD